MPSTIQEHAGTPEDPLERIFTVSNVITFIRLCMIPAFFIFMLAGINTIACLLFALAASTDWLDGQIARRTNTVSKLGRALDPCVDRLLMIFGVLSVYLVGRVPLWVIVVVLARDIGMMLGYVTLMARYRIRIDVIYAGKVATTLLFIGFALLILNFPIANGFAITSVPWLPGFNGEPCSVGIWFIYSGLLLCIYTTAHYINEAFKQMKKVTGDSQE